ncbi:unnamed protein product [Rangifer tarandus platyrhynchus]|uniref:Uncharacterized protein n=1 Tax=Rangifer tarandus platyrhynchus TaxID=3082113 RepID=A0AC59YKV2_RANTA
MARGLGEDVDVSEEGALCLPPGLLALSGSVAGRAGGGLGIAKHPRSSGQPLTAENGQAPDSTRDLSGNPWKRGGGLGADRSGSSLWLGCHPSPPTVGSAGRLYSTSLPEGTSPDSRGHPQAERTVLPTAWSPLHPGTPLCLRVRGAQSRSRGRSGHPKQKGAPFSLVGRAWVPRAADTRCPALPIEKNVFIGFARILARYSAIKLKKKSCLQFHHREERCQH